MVKLTYTPYRKYTSTIIPQSQVSEGEGTMITPWTKVSKRTTDQLCRTYSPDQQRKAPDHQTRQRWVCIKILSAFTTRTTFLALPPVPQTPSKTSSYMRLFFILIRRYNSSLLLDSDYVVYRHTPSGQCRVHRVTQLRTDGVNCRESAGTGTVVFKVVPVTGAVFACHHGPIILRLFFPTPALLV